MRRSAHTDPSVDPAPTPEQLPLLRLPNALPGHLSDQRFGVTAESGEEVTQRAVLVIVVAPAHTFSSSTFLRASHVGLGEGYDHGLGLRRRCRGNDAMPPPRRCFSMSSRPSCATGFSAPSAWKRPSGLRQGRRDEDLPALGHRQPRPETPAPKAHLPRRRSLRRRVTSNPTNRLDFSSLRGENTTREGLVDQLRTSWNSLLGWLREAEAWSLAAEAGK